MPIGISRISRLRVRNAYLINCRFNINEHPVIALTKEQPALPMASITNTIYSPGSISVRPLLSINIDFILLSKETTPPDIPTF